MSGPWEDYASTASTSKPWEDYASQGLRGEGFNKAMNYTGADATGGLLRGAGSIGATLMRLLPNALGGDTAEQSQTRRANLDPSISQFVGSNPDSSAYKTSKILAEIGGTAGIGGGAANVLGHLPFVAKYAAPLLDSIGTAGMSAGGMSGLSGGAMRAAGGAANGYLSAGAIDPNNANTGALIGGSVPPLMQMGGAAGNAIRNSLGNVSPEVSALAQRAKDLNINIPADRLVNSRPLNAVAAGLNYVPFSGRAATEDAMNSQLNKALSNTFGQDSSNVTMALRQAKPVLGGEFDRVLSSNTVKVDPQFVQDLTDATNRASRELGTDSASIIQKQVDDILAKSVNGEINGQAAYNIKKTLDRIGNRNSPEAYYATDLKKSLMGALDRSLGTQESASFAATRQQYGNMLDLQNLAKNGAEGEVSVARLGNMKDINNPQMQELADIAAQFVKAREGAHGAAQRATVGGVAAYFGGLPAMAGGVAAGRGANMFLNSDMARNYILNQQGLLGNTPGMLGQEAYRAFPLIPGLLQGN